MGGIRQTRRKKKERRRGAGREGTEVRKEEGRIPIWK